MSSVIAAAPRNDCFPRKHQFQLMNKLPKPTLLHDPVTRRNITAMSPSIPPLKTSCHCNAISLTTQAPPKLMNECQCSICRRYGAQWSYYPIDQKDHGVEVNGVPITDYHVREDGKFEVQAQSLVLPTRTYSWGDDLEWFVFCEKCGCIMFWYPQRSAAEGGNGKMGELVLFLTMRSCDVVLAVFFRAFQNEHDRKIFLEKSGSLTLTVSDRHQRKNGE